MFNEFEVKLTTEYIGRIVKNSPKGAIKELVWNSCDADATEVAINYYLNEIEGIEKVIVKDNGHGIKYEKIIELFGEFGRSDKTYSNSSPLGRIFHGKFGQGRYQSFAIGNKITWHSVYKSEDGNKYSFSIICDSQNKMKMNLSTKQKIENNIPTGVIVEIKNISSDSNIGCLLNEESIIQELLTNFAPYILAYKNIVIKYNDKTISPEKNIEETIERDISFMNKNTNTEHFAHVKIICWNKNDISKVYICGNSGVVFGELDFEENKKLPVSVYIMSEYFEQMHKNRTIDAGKLDDVFNSFFEQSIDIFSEYAKEKNSTFAMKEFLRIKEGKIYPYEGEPRDNLEKMERQVFDVLALEINNIIPQFQSANIPTKKLTYRLIKEAVKNNPDSLTKILTEVFGLSLAQQDDLAKMLDFTTLPSIINTAKVVSDRLLFLNALEQMVYNNEVGKPIKERCQFHKILLQELWIFGDKYTYGADDVSLKNVLKEYIKFLGREELIPDIPKEAIEDLTRIPDICLWQQYPNRYEDVENLVIELKRPLCIIGKDELDQIEAYAFKIAENKIFPKENTKWNFILLGKDFNAYTQRRLQDSKNGTGNFYNSEDGKISISILRWNKVIQDNKLKHQFLKDKLNYQVNESEKAVEYLRRKYAAIFVEDEK